MIDQQEAERTVAAPDGLGDLAIEIEGMRKAYSRTVAVQDLSLHVPRGSIFGFVGPNGAGKTTTIRTLATLQSADAGVVRVAGIDVRTDPDGVRDRVGYMPDFFGVYESLTVEEYLEFYGASYRVPVARRHQLCDELLELVDLQDKRFEAVEGLSRGMKQRLGLARCLIHDPEVLLLDEPASGMDPRARIELREILRELRAMGKTILISSHILPELAEMCTHIGIIRAGQLLAEGTVEAVIAALGSGAQLRVRVLDDSTLDAVIGVLAAFPACGEVERDGARGVTLPFTGSDADLAHILAELQSAGLPVIGFGLEENTLEDIFFRMTELGEHES